MPMWNRTVKMCYQKKNTVAGFCLNGLFMYLLFKPHKLHNGIYHFRLSIVSNGLQKVEVR